MAYADPDYPRRIREALRSRAKRPYRSAFPFIARAAWSLTPPHVKLGLAAGVVGAGVYSRVTQDKPLSSKSRPMPVSDMQGGFYNPPWKKQKVVHDKSGYVQLTKLPFVSVGKQLSRQEMLNRHTEAQMFKRIDRFQNMSGAAAVNGKYWLAYAQDGVAGVLTKYYYPCYTFDLTSLANNIAFDSAGASSTCKSLPFLRLTRVVRSGVNPVTNYYDWQVQSGIGGNGTTSSTAWQTERLPYADTSASNYPYSKALLKDCDIKLQFWGARNFPSSAEVLLVRFTDENVGPPSFEDLGGNTKTLHPTPPVPTDTTTGDTNDFAQYEKFWSSQMDRFLGTPMNTRFQAKDSKGMQVIWSKRIDFNPTANYETDTTGHQYTLQLKYIMDMIGSYNHYNANDAYGDGYNGEVLWPDPNVWPQTVDVKDTHACLRNKNSRVFLMIRGLSTTTITNALGAGLATENASFDIMVRRSVTLI